MTTLIVLALAAFVAVTVTLALLTLRARRLEHLSTAEVERRTRPARWHRSGEWVE